MKRRKPYKRPSKIREIIILHVRNNFNSYLIACIIFLVSVALGVVFINNISDMQTQDLKDYLLTKLKSVQTNEATYLKDLIIENSLLIILMWLLGLSMIGIIINYLIIIFKGFCLGYTAAAIALTLGTWKGISYIFASIVIQNLLFIPAIIIVTTSGMRFFKLVIQDRRKENILLEGIRHTLISSGMLLVVILSAFLEIYQSGQLIKLIKIC